jgi:hypothetical protein
VQTAHNNKPLSGYVEINHPFHPLKGQRFQLLKSRHIAGVEILSLKDTTGGTFTVNREWTDYSVPSQIQFPPLFLNFDCLLALVDIIEQLKSKDQQES